MATYSWKKTEIVKPQTRIRSFRLQGQKPASTVGPVSWLISWFGGKSFNLDCSHATWKHSCLHSNIYLVATLYLQSCSVLEIRLRLALKTSSRGAEGPVGWWLLVFSLLCNFQRWDCPHGWKKANYEANINSLGRVGTRGMASPENSGRPSVIPTSPTCPLRTSKTARLEQSHNLQGSSMKKIMYYRENKT